ncbi:phosphonatase-like hydrolase [Saonia flava]|uniref:Phosphonatase-like hydrolase n=1 Tax=Saonia flava TaxID=523696 RepID=A0A846QTG5_9FLAO|nr:phosphonatase-like hydrolase [Saonia flava]NJB71338.1 phosphonatase-like hydrolase [Saonia flava]
MSKIELVVFDMAGTVVNEDNVVYKTLQKAINKEGYLLTLDSVLEHGAGKEKHQAIKDILKICEGHEQDTIAASIFENFKKLLENAYQNLKVESYPGVENLIQTLREKNIMVALNTGYDKNTAQLLLDKMSWKLEEQYDALVTADDVILGRPNPDMIFEAMDLLSIKNPSTVLKAGDSIIDIEEGKNAKCGITVGVTTGAHTREQLLSANPTYILDSLNELKKILID